MWYHHDSVCSRHDIWGPSETLGGQSTSYPTGNSAQCCFQYLGDSKTELPVLGVGVLLPKTPWVSVRAARKLWCPGVEWGHSPHSLLAPVTVQLLVRGALGWALGCGNEGAVIQLGEKMSPRNCVRDEAGDRPLSSQPGTYGWWCARHWGFFQS